MSQKHADEARRRAQAHAAAGNDEAARAWAAAADEEEMADDHKAAAGQGTLLCDRCERDMTEDDIRIGLNNGVVCPECHYLERLTKADLQQEAALAGTRANKREDDLGETDVVTRALRAWARLLRIEAK